VIALYAITDDSGPPPPELERLEVVPIDGLAAVCTRASEPEFSEDAFWRHEEVVEALMEDRDLVPVRYGTRLEDEGAVVRAVEERRDELLAALQRVRGAVELSVRVVATGKQPPVPSKGDEVSGAEYMRSRASGEADRKRASSAVHEPLSILARASAEGRPRAHELCRWAYLVGRESVDTFAAAVALLQDRHPELSILCTGPWPPYSFVAR
jgi:gas vesicle protein GvpL/GvpF